MKKICDGSRDKKTEINGTTTTIYKINTNNIIGWL